MEAQRRIALIHANDIVCSDRHELPARWRVVTQGTMRAQQAASPQFGLNGQT
jgi:hypothetical protein